MKSRACWLAVLAVFLGPPVLGQVADETTVPRISVADLKRAADAGQVLIIDVRDASWYAEGHLPGAINVPLDALQQSLGALKAAKKVIVAYCA
jgi:rhodanese-related sulfurtransferase